MQNHKEHRHYKTLKHMHDDSDIMSSCCHKAKIIGIHENRNSDASCCLTLSQGCCGHCFWHVQCDLKVLLCHTQQASSVVLQMQPATNFTKTHLMLQMFLLTGVIANKQKVMQLWMSKKRFYHSVKESDVIHHCHCNWHVQHYSKVLF